MFGVCAARTLHDRGYRVQVLDPGQLPRPYGQASSVDSSRAVRMDYGADAFYSEQAERAWHLWRGEWNERFGEPVYQETGFLFGTGRSFDEPGFEADSYRLLCKRGHPLERLSPSEVASRFPLFGADVWVDGYFNPHAGVARASRVLELLLAELAGAGVVLRGQQPIGGLVEEQGRVVGVMTAAGERIEADAVLVTAGAWTPALLPQLQELLRPTAQTLLYFRPDNPDLFGAPAWPTWAFDIGRLGWYGFPTAEGGLVKVAHHGKGVSKPPSDRSPDEGLEARVRAFLSRAVPELADAPVGDCRVCFYCDSLDGDFWIGGDPERPGLFVAAGGSGHGFKFAPVLGDWIADAVEGRVEPQMARLGWRTPGRGAEAARADDESGS